MTELYTDRTERIVSSARHAKRTNVIECDTCVVRTSSQFLESFRPFDCLDQHARFDCMIHLTTIIANATQHVTTVGFLSLLVGPPFQICRWDTCLRSTRKRHHTRRVHLNHYNTNIQCQMKLDKLLCVSIFFLATSVFSLLPFFSFNFKFSFP